MPGGRPPTVTESVVTKLEEAFALGCSDEEACVFADISTRALYRYQERNEEFRRRKETLKKTPVLMARRAMMDLIKSKDESIKHKAATDTLNRYDGKPVDRMEHSGPNGGPMETKTEWVIQPVKPINEV